MSAQMTRERITAATGVAAEGALEGFFARVQLNVPQQISLLSERDTTLVALEWPLTFTRRHTHTGIHLTALTVKRVI